MALFHRKAPSTPKAVVGDFDERAAVRNGKLTIDGRREALVHDPTGTIRLIVTQLSVTNSVIPTLDLPLQETEDVVRGIVAGSIRDIHRTAIIRGIATIGRDRIGVLSATRHASDVLHDSLDVELTALDTDELASDLAGVIARESHACRSIELAADLAGVIVRESHASRSIELTAPHASVWVPFRAVIGSDSSASGDLYVQGVLPREDFDRLASDIASDRVEELCLSCRTDLWVRSPTLSPQIWYMPPGKIGRGMIDEIWWSKSYDTDIRPAKKWLQSLARNRLSRRQKARRV